MAGLAIALTALASGLLALLDHRSSGALGRALGGAWRSAASRPAHAVVACGLLGLAFGPLHLACVGPSRPSVHDEFSYLLAADTFAHGRLTNPPLRPRVMFETMHVLLEPTYMSKFPPGVGLSLAAGQVLWSNPIVGAWLTLGAACAALTWCCFQVLPPRWALVAAIVGSLHPIVMAWATSYWGGGVGLLGGALVLGGLGKARRAAARGGILAGSGAGILALSRPFEGLVLVVVIGGAFVVRARSKEWKRVAVTVAALVATAAPLLVWLGYYNQRVTGSFWRLPYFEWNQQYSQAPQFLFLPPAPPKTYQSDQLTEFHANERAFWEAHRGWPGLLRSLSTKARVTAVSFVQPMPLALLALALSPITLLTSATARRWWLLLALFLAGLGTSLWTVPHYMAPAYALATATATSVVAPVLIRVARRNATLLPLLVLAGLSSLFVAPGIPALRAVRATSRPGDWAQRRHAIEEWLRAQPGRHLVLVRYGPTHNVHHEWVYNRADVGASRVIWARRLTRKATARILVNLFPDRRVWTLDADKPAAWPEPYLDGVEGPAQGRSALAE